jgi:hypothetical protein
MRSPLPPNVIPDGGRNLIRTLTHCKGKVTA